MEKWICELCGYEYDEATGDSDNGIAAGTKFEDIPEDWVCPLCGAGKSEFKKILINKKMPKHQSKDVSAFFLLC